MGANDKIIGKEKKLDLEALLKEKKICPTCGNEMKRYTDEQITALKRYDPMPACSLWTVYCAKKGVVPHDICYKEANLRGDCEQLKSKT